MWMRLASVLTVAAVAAVAPIPGSGQAYANPWGEVDCAQFPDHADCQAEAGVPDDGGWSAGAGGEVVCHDDRGEVVDCFVEGQGWIGADGCRYFFNGSEPPPEGVTEPGGWYVRQCSETPGGEVVWLPDSDAPGPGLLAQVAVSRLVLPPPELELNPPAAQLVMVPTWLWVSPQWWVQRSASASVPGLTVTAVATPTEVRWDTGDGAAQTCDAGTPYPAEVDPAESSPDCGHTYTRTSQSQPDGVFLLSATVSWQVTWSGGGASGTAGPLVSTASLPVEVVESLARNTRSG